MKKIRWIVLCALLAVCPGCDAQKHDGLPPGYTLLFDGKDFTFQDDIGIISTETFNSDSKTIAAAWGYHDRYEAFIAARNRFKPVAAPAPEPAPKPKLVRVHSVSRFPWSISGKAFDLAVCETGHTFTMEAEWLVETNSWRIPLWQPHVLTNPPTQLWATNCYVTNYIYWLEEPKEGTETLTVYSNLVLRAIYRGATNEFCLESIPFTNYTRRWKLERIYQ